MVHPPIVAGNWKMHKTPLEGVSFVGEVKKRVLDKDKVKVIFCPPFTSLFNMVGILEDTSFGLAAQNVHWETAGAYTGEISVSMLKACGTNTVILGHSERRHIFGESNEWINQKTLAVLHNGMFPILCIGEILEDREAGETPRVLENQLKKGLQNVEPEYLNSMVIAYEPVWAIGTGVVATIDQVEEAHQTVKTVLGSLYPDSKTNEIPILYGGSVKPENAEELIRTPGVDGFLIGGASLKQGPFCDIIDIVEQNYVRN